VKIRDAIIDFIAHNPVSLTINLNGRRTAHKGRGGSDGRRRARGLQDRPYGTCQFPRSASSCAFEDPERAWDPTTPSKEELIVHFVLQGKGGVGKSYAAVLLAQYLRQRGLPVSCFDGDPLNQTLGGFASLEVSLVPPPEINRSGFTEETHWTIAYSPVPDDTVASRIGGVLGTVHGGVG
jgi:hypothetical protein